MKYGSLFSGIGGIDLGFDRAGLECVWQVEIDDYAQKVLAKHWTKVHREKDIRDCGKHNLESVDVIAGGFPCQDISYAGRGAGLDGERSGLFFEAVRVVRELQPRFVVLENVAALLTRGMDRVLGTLAEVGYDAEWHCIPAAAVGAPHIRDRVFVIAHSVRDSYGINDNSKQARHTKDTNSGGVSRRRDQRNPPDVANANVQHGERGSESRQSKCEERKSRTEFSGSGSNVADSDSSGFEDASGCQEIAQCGWKRTFSRSSWWDAEPDVDRVANGVPFRVDRLRGLGNAVVPQVAEWIGRRLMQIEKIEIK